MRYPIRGTISSVRLVDDIRRQELGLEYRRYIYRLDIVIVESERSDPRLAGKKKLV